MCPECPWFVETCLNLRVSAQMTNTALKPRWWDVSASADLHQGSLWSAALNYTDSPGTCDNFMVFFPWLLLHLHGPELLSSFTSNYLLSLFLLPFIKIFDQILLLSPSNLSQLTRIFSYTHRCALLFLCLLVRGHEKGYLPVGNFPLLQFEIK